MEKLVIEDVKSCNYDSDSSTYIVVKTNGKRGSIDGFLDSVDIDEVGCMRICFSVVEDLIDESS